MTIGERTKLVHFYKPSPIVDGANQSTGWILHKSKWAWIKTETGMGRIRSESSAGGINTNLMRYSFRIKYDLTIDTTMQVRDPKGNFYNILTLIHDHASEMWTDVVAEIGGSNG